MASLISIQLNGKSSVNENIQRLSALVQQACEKADQERLVVLPECASIFGVNGKQMLAIAELYGKGPVQNALSALAKEHTCYLVAGTIPILQTENASKYLASSLVFDPSGKCIAQYNKIHLFDVDVADKTASYRESAYTIAGENISIFNTPFASVGQSVCYDLRFPSMFAAMAKFNANRQAPSILVVPSAFTKTTGQAHWHALLQARSIENQCFVVASNQTGSHQDGRETFGHSCIYSPWGECLSIIEESEGFAIAEFDQSYIDKIRLKMPIHQHKKERYTIER